MRVVTIGAGLGGLLTSAFLAKAGHEVTILEKAPFVGGRFTNLNYKGFQLSTGALHMVPHGENGPLAHLLKLLNANVEIVNSNPKGKFFLEGSLYHYREGWKYLSLKEKAKAMKLLAEIKANRLPSGEDANMSSWEWLQEKIGDNEFVYLFIKSFLGWAVSLAPEEVPAIELAREIKATLKWGGPGLIKGGCKAVTEELARIVRENGGKIITRKKAVEIDENKVITADGEEYPYDVLISNIGIKETVELFGRDKFDREYLKKVDALKPAEGIKINVALKGEPRIGNTVVFTLDTQRINGYNEPSALTPELAREGYTLIMTHQALRSKDVKKEQKLGIEDLYYLFPELDKEGEVLMVQTYLDRNPVNRVASGTHLDFPLENVYIVGDANKGEGGIEVEGIALGVMKTLENLGIGRFSEWYL
ncbi:phytoene desaturase family protein [Thermococcus alcaliphilus]|uniref:phytoene desaturase family protein n=1 Tax=Thermococcus alcaliphilus TaxID=139207 RepID=UPI0020915997|nr:NAD(P)/FAD-dependent oxidoreductase [Thermococcus alcaliphilus]MCO6040461.1 NAD(P)/FAD-dependent oxidoreductase [Thermococcus alcaliphilus]